jgi:hypothetical protein
MSADYGIIVRSVGLPLAGRHPSFCPSQFKVAEIEQNVICLQSTDFERFLSSNGLVVTSKCR